MQVELWDTGNMEHSGFQNMRSPVYWHNYRAVILVYDTGDIETLNELRWWILLAKDYANGQNLLFSLWGNHTGNTSNPVDEEDARNFAAKFDIHPSLMFDVTASTGDNLLDSYQRLVNEVHLMNTNQPPRDRAQSSTCIQLGARQSSGWNWCCGST